MFHSLNVNMTMAKPTHFVEGHHNMFENSLKI